MLFLSLSSSSMILKSFQMYSTSITYQSDSIHGIDDEDDQLVDVSITHLGRAIGSAAQAMNPPPPPSENWFERAWDESTRLVHSTPWYGKRGPIHSCGMTKAEICILLAIAIATVGIMTLTWIIIFVPS